MIPLIFFWIDCVDISDSTHKEKVLYEAIMGINPVDNCTAKIKPCETSSKATGLLYVFL